MDIYYFDAKTTVEQAIQLSIFKLKEFGLLTEFLQSIKRNSENREEK